MSFSSGAATTGTGTTWLRRLECEEMTPVYLTTCLRGGGTKAAKRAMRASGARSTDEVPSDHGRLNSSLTSPSSRIFSRSLASSEAWAQDVLTQVLAPLLVVGGDFGLSMEVETAGRGDEGDDPATL